MRLLSLVRSDGGSLAFERESNATVEAPESPVWDFCHSPAYSLDTVEGPGAEYQQREGEHPYDWVQRLQRGVRQLGLGDGQDAVAWCAKVLSEELSELLDDTMHAGAKPPVHSLWEAAIFRFPPLSDLRSFFGWVLARTVTEQWFEQAEYLVNHSTWVVVTDGNVCRPGTAMATLDQHTTDLRRLEACTEPAALRTGIQTKEKLKDMFMRAMGPQGKQILTIASGGTNVSYEELRTRVSNLSPFPTSKFPPLPAGCIWDGPARPDVDPTTEHALTFTETELESVPPCSTALLLDKGEAVQAICGPGDRQRRRARRPDLTAVVGVAAQSTATT
ncbi:hypothetical protein HDU93_003260 [Gonapodya sp. JEL0774]|nr:hypothetical protein HDU93_003260 [Gonapodya sp. JEL0774]